MKELEGNIENVDGKINHIESSLKNLRKIQDQVSTKTAVRSTLFKEQQRQYVALEEENEGLFFFFSFFIFVCVLLYVICIIVFKSCVEEF